MLPVSIMQPAPQAPAAGADVAHAVEEEQKEEEGEAKTSEVREEQHGMVERERGAGHERELAGPELLGWLALMGEERPSRAAEHGGLPVVYLNVLLVRWRSPPPLQVPPPAAREEEEVAVLSSSRRRTPPPRLVVVAVVVIMAMATTDEGRRRLGGCCLVLCR